MTVGTWGDPLFQSQSGTAYKTNLDNCFAVVKRVGDSFAPHAKATPDMNVLVDAGAVLADQVLVEKTQQTIGPFTAPSTNPRIDRIVVDVLTGVASIVAGTEAGSPVAPSIPDDKFPVCQIALSVAQSTITNANITDERILGVSGGRKTKDRVTTDAVVGNTGTETDIYRKSITNLLGTNKTVVLTLAVKAKQHNAPGTGVFIIRCKYGGTTLITTNTIDVNSVSFVNDLLTFVLFADGATNAQLGRFWGQGSYVPNDVLRGTAAEDSTVAKDIAVTVDWDGANGADQNFTMEAAVLEQV